MISFLISFHQKKLPCIYLYIINKIINHKIIKFIYNNIKKVSEVVSNKNIILYFFFKSQYIICGDRSVLHELIFARRAVFARNVIMHD